MGRRIVTLRRESKVSTRINVVLGAVCTQVRRAWKTSIELRHIFQLSSGDIFSEFKRASSLIIFQQDCIMRAILLLSSAQQERKSSFCLCSFCVPTPCPSRSSCKILQNSPSLSDKFESSQRARWLVKTAFRQHFFVFDHFCREGFPFGVQNATTVDMKLPMSCVGLIW